jgi:hypothetical protein
MARRIESFFISGPAGRLEALLEEPEDREAAEAALVCHPHPLHGGTMHNKVVHRLARGLRSAGCAVLRFNFRGVNLSHGEHDGGRGEMDDAAACLEVLRARYPSLPLTLAGFSFGSRTVLALAARMGGRAPSRVIAAGFPTIYADVEFVAQCQRPRIFIHSTSDEYGPRRQMQALYDRLWGPKALYWVEAQDHFFTGALEELERLVVEVAAARAFRYP